MKIDLAKAAKKKNVRREKPKSHYRVDEEENFRKLIFDYN